MFYNDDLNYFDN
jgi:hypothetical protein